MLPGRTRIDHSFLTMSDSIVASSRRSEAFESSSEAARAFVIVRADEEEEERSDNVPDGTATLDN